MAAAAIFRPIGDQPTGFGPTGYGAAPALTAAQQRTAEIQSDPAYASAQNAATANANTAAAQRQAAIRALAIQFGGLPAGFQDQYGDIDQATRDAAAQNQFSQYAVANRQAAQGAEADRQSLASRGASDSGATPGILGQEGFNQGQALDTLGNQFGSSVGSAISDYAGALNTNANNLATATEQAEQNQNTNPAYVSSSALNPVAPSPVAPARTITPKSTFAPSASPFRVAPQIRLAAGRM